MENDVKIQHRVIDKIEEKRQKGQIVHFLTGSGIQDNYFYNYLEGVLNLADSLKTYYLRKENEKNSEKYDFLIHCSYAAEAVSYYKKNLDGEIDQIDFKDLKSMFSQTYDKSGNIVYSVNITPEALQEAFNKASNIEYNSNADDDAQRAYASTKDQASDLLSSGIKDKNINDQIQVIQNNMIGKGATTRAELDKKENKIEAETNKHLKEQYGITVKNTKARENELKLKKNLSTIEQKELDNLQKYNKAKKESEKRSKAYATVVAQEEQALTELGKNWNKYNKAFKAGDKGSDDYKSGVQAVQKAFQTNFGNEDMQIQDFIDDDFIEKHRESIDKMLNGDKEAYQKLRKDIAKEYIKGIKLNIDKDSFNGSLKDARQKLQDWAAKIPRPKLGVDLDEKYVKQLNVIG